jgi:cation:H+ antiporter
MMNTLLSHIGLFAFAALMIGIAGTKLAGLADQLADRTGMGEAIAGVVFLGFITSLPGVSASVSSAWDGHVNLTISNAIGGIAVQTVFIAIADFFYRKSNLEHAAASLQNLLQCIVLIALLTILLLAFTSPNIMWFHVHPFSVLLFAVAGLGLYLVRYSRDKPMWHPRKTRETIEDKPEAASQERRIAPLILALTAAAAVVLLGGAIAAKSASQLAEASGLSQSLVGGIFLALATSLPELVTTIAAVKRGAVTLAVSDIVGGNFFDTLFVALADFFYRPGSIYHASSVGHLELFLIGLAILLNAILLIGLLYRQTKGPINIGMEGIFMLLVYVGGYALIFGN